jgi:hypothetical protein
MGPNFIFYCPHFCQLLRICEPVDIHGRFRARVAASNPHLFIEFRVHSTRLPKCFSQKEYEGGGCSNGGRNNAGGSLEESTAWDSGRHHGPLNSLSWQLDWTAAHSPDAAVAQELDAKTLLLQSQLDYIQARDELTQAMGRTAE